MSISNLEVIRICFRVVLLCVGVVAFSFVAPSFAEGTEADVKTVKTYNIPAGTLQDALQLFSKQAGVKLEFNPALTQGKVSFGLTGDHGVKVGLDQILSGSGLQAIEQQGGYTVLEIAESSSDPVVTTLPSIQVTADNVSNRYAAASTSTATKTNTLLRDVPQSISVITNQLIQDQSIRSIGDAIRYVPGVGVSQGEGNRDAVVFRGNRSTGDFFTDGIRDDVEYYRDLYNIERVEVLKGANGMIFGRGGSGGVINRVTKQANWNPTKEFFFQGGSYNLKRMTADVGHVINDVVAVRLNALYEDAGSFRDGGDSERLGISPTVTIKPTNRTKVVVNMERYHDDRVADRGIPSFNGQPVNVPRSQFFGDPRRSHANVEVLGFNSFIEHKFESGVTFQNRTNYALYDKFYQNIYAASQYTASRGVFLGAYNNTADRENVFNQTNLIYSLNTGPFLHTLMAGVEVGRQETHNRRQSGTFRGGNNQVFLNNSITNVPVTFATSNAIGNVDAYNRSVVNVTSLYIQDQIEFTPQLQVVAGVRYDLFEVDFQQKNGTKEHLKTSDDLIAPRFGVIYKPFEPISFYGSYSRAYVPRAGDQLTGLDVTTAVLKPEKFTTLEAGVKWDIRPDLAVTGAVFQLDRTNVITIDPVDSSKSFLTKGQRTHGVEVGINGQLTSNWNIMGGYAYQVGEITSNQLGAPKGASVGELPRHTFSVWNRYDFTPRIGAAVGVIYRGSMFASTDNTVRIPDFTRVDAALFAQFSKHFRGQLNIENIFDVHYFASVQNNNNISPGSPIAVRASLIANF